MSIEDRRACATTPPPASLAQFQKQLVTQAWHSVFSSVYELPDTETDSGSENSKDDENQDATVPTDVKTKAVQEYRKDLSLDFVRTALKINLLPGLADTVHASLRMWEKLVGPSNSTVKEIIDTTTAVAKDPLSTQMCLTPIGEKILACPTEVAKQRVASEKAIKRLETINATVLKGDKFEVFAKKMKAAGMSASRLKETLRGFREIVLEMKKVRETCG